MMYTSSHITSKSASGGRRTRGYHHGFCWHLILDVVHAMVNVCANMQISSMKILVNMRIGTVAADTSDLYSANRAFCGAPWPTNMSKKGRLFSQAPLFDFCRFF